MNDTTGIYDDGATYGPDETAQTNEPTGSSIYDDGAVYGNAAAAINDGLADLFLRLGPPTDRTTEKRGG